MQRVGILAAVSGIVGVALLALGVVYLTVACENLPGFMGPHAGDTSPRTGLGIAGVVFGLIALAGALAGTRRRPPPASLGT
jgi:hypothetical protein